MQIQSDGSVSLRVDMALGWVPGLRPRSPACGPRPWKSSPSRLLSSPACLPAGPAHPNCSRYGRLRCCDTPGGRGPGTDMLGQQLPCSITVPKEGRDRADHNCSSPPTQGSNLRAPAVAAPRLTVQPPLGGAQRSGNSEAGFLEAPGGRSPITKAHSYTV